MPKYSRKVEIPGKSAKELYEVIAREIDHFLTKASIGEFSLERNADRQEVKFKASMASGTLQCRDGALDLEVQLSLLATPFRSKIDSGIDRWLAKNFNLSSTSIV